MTSTSCDVAIIGGGPAGATAAYVLAKKGHEVVVLEREKFPRFHIGESLLPFQQDLIDRLGLREKIDAISFQRKNGAHFVSNDGSFSNTLRFEDFLSSPRNVAWEVERAEFDDMLLRHAEEGGAEVREEQKVMGCDFSDDGNVLTIRGRDGEESQVRSRWVIDASGQNSFLGKTLGLRRPVPDLKKVALFSHYQGATRRSGKEDGDITLVMGNRCWFWMIPLRNNVTSVGCVTDRSRWASDVSAEDFLAEQIRLSPFVSEILASSEQTEKVRTASSFSYGSSRYVGKGWMMAGDAAAFLDPVFSTGVLIAMRSGELAASQLSKRLMTGRPLKPSHFRSYERSLRGWTEGYFRLIRAFYNPGFAGIFFNPKPGYQAIVAPFFLGKFELKMKEKLFLRLFYLLIRMNRKWNFSPDPRPPEYAIYHG